MTEKITDFYLILRGEAKEKIKSLLRFIARLVWRKPLERAGSINILQDGVVYKKQHEPIVLSKLASASGVTTQKFQKDQNIVFDEDYIWKLEISEQIKSINVCLSGIVLINKKYLLDLDFGSTAGLLDLPFKKERNRYPIVIAPWSHLWASYYDFVLLVVAKLCRIENALGSEVFQEAKICYPFINKNYFEKQFFFKFNIDKNSLINTRNRNIEISTDCIILANNQKQLLYPSPYDIALLRNKFYLSVSTQTKKRLYLSRSARRQIKNEEEVRNIVKKFDFEIVEDIYRSVDEQIRLFKSASAIISPHGAGLTNLLWCDPGTQVIEFFGGGYVRQHYYYISKLLKLKYYYIIENINVEDHWQKRANNMMVDVVALEKQLKKLFVNNY